MSIDSSKHEIIKITYRPYSRYIYIFCAEYRWTEISCNVGLTQLQLNRKYKQIFVTVNLKNNYCTDHVWPHILVHTSSSINYHSWSTFQQEKAHMRTFAHYLMKLSTGYRRHLINCHLQQKIPTNQAIYFLLQFT